MNLPLPVAKTTEKITVEDIDKAPENLPAPISVAVSREEYNTLLVRFGEISDKNNNLSEENSKLKRERNTSNILDDLIKPYAFRTFVFMCVYCAIVAGALGLHLFDYATKPLSDGVLQALVGSTAVTVIGLVGMVLTGIFVGARK